MIANSLQLCADRFSDRKGGASRTALLHKQYRETLREVLK